MPKKTPKQIHQEKLYEEWKRRKASPTPPPPPPPQPLVHKHNSINTPRREDYEHLARENRAKYPEIARMVDEIRQHFPGAKVVAVRPRRDVVKRQAPTTPSPDEEA